MNITIEDDVPYALVRLHPGKEDGAGVSIQSNIIVVSMVKTTLNLALESLDKKNVTMKIVDHPKGSIDAAKETEQIIKEHMREKVN